MGFFQYLAVAEGQAREEAHSGKVLLEFRQICAVLQRAYNLAAGPSEQIVALLIGIDDFQSAGEFLLEAKDVEASEAGFILVEAIKDLVGEFNFKFFSLEVSACELVAEAFDKGVTDLVEDALVELAVKDDFVGESEALETVHADAFGVFVDLEQRVALIDQDHVVVFGEHGGVYLEGLLMHHHHKTAVHQAEGLLE